MKTFFNHLFTFLLVIFFSCQKDQISTHSHFTNEVLSARGGGGGSQTFTIGQNYGGGIIFDIDGSGQHGLIVATEELGYLPWAPGITSIPTNTTSLEGYFNTKKILQVYGNLPNYNLPYAALATKQYKGSGFSDWYLPSTYEFGKISHYFISSPYEYYWTSTQSNANGQSADMICTFCPNVITKSVFNLHKAVAIRKF